MFSSKVDVLESKLSMYEDLSKEMLEKLETAVQKISEGNSRIAQILAKHDERIEQSMKTDALIIKMIDELKEESDKDHKIIHQRIDHIQKKIEEISKFRWMAAGIVAAVICVTPIVVTVFPSSSNVQNISK